VIGFGSIRCFNMLLWIAIVGGLTLMMGSTLVMNHCSNRRSLRMVAMKSQVGSPRGRGRNPEPELQCRRCATACSAQKCLVQSLRRQRFLLKNSALKKQSTTQRSPCHLYGVAWFSNGPYALLCVSDRELRSCRFRRQRRQAGKSIGRAFPAPDIQRRAQHPYSSR